MCDAPGGMVYALMLTYSERTLEGNLVLLDVVNGSIRDSGLAVFDDGSDIDRLPSNGGLENAVLELFSLVTYAGCHDEPWRRRRCP